MPKISRICHAITAAGLCVWAFTADAQFIAEFYNGTTGGYFLSSDPGETAFVDGGGAGRGWVRTGYSFETVCNGIYPQFNCTPTVPVCRFYGAPPAGSGSHFFTADPDECAFVRQNPAWHFEGTPFRAALPNSSTGLCPDDQVPIYRAYNNAAKSTDVRHRWTASRAVRDRMLAKGWKDEGIAFCAISSEQTSLRGVTVQVDSDHILTSAQCAANVSASRSCIGMNNLPRPQFVQYIDPNDPALQAIGDTIGDYHVYGPVYSVAGPSLTAAASDTFVELAGPSYFGIHVDTASRGPASLSSVNPIYQFELSPPADGKPDNRLVPFGGQYDTDTELVISFNFLLKRVVTSPGSSAYGHSTLDVWDRRSNLHFYFIAFVYGTVPTIDQVLRDGPEGNVIVATAFRNSSFGRNYAAQVMATPSPFQWPGDGAGGQYELHIDRTEFLNAIAAARTLEPRLSTDPSDYAIDDYHFNSEVAGDGEIGETLSYMGLRLVAH